VKRKFLAAVFAATMAVSGLVGVAPASATDPAVTEQPTISLSGTELAVTYPTWTITAGDTVETNLIACRSPISAVTTPSTGGIGDCVQMSGEDGEYKEATLDTIRLQDQFINLASQGGATWRPYLDAGELNDHGYRHLVIRSSVFRPSPTDDFTLEKTWSVSTASVTFGAPTISRQPAISLSGTELTVTYPEWATSAGDEVENYLLGCISPVQALTIPSTDSFGAPCRELSSSDDFSEASGSPINLATQKLNTGGANDWTDYLSEGQLNNHIYKHLVIISVFEPNGTGPGDDVWLVWTASTEYIPGNVTSTGGDTVAPTPFTGPVLNTPAIGAAVAGGKLVISGSNLGGVSKIEIGGLDAQVVVLADGSIEITVPRGLTPGVYDIVINSDAGRVTVQGGLTVAAGAVAGEVRPSTKLIAENRVKVWAFGTVGAGKVQIKLNGREVAWANALSADDPKLRDGYLVRTLTLAAGKNVIEVYVDGERVSRRVATGS